MKNLTNQSEIKGGHVAIFGVVLMFALVLLLTLAMAAHHISPF